MITAYLVEDGRLTARRLAAGERFPEDAVWIDLQDPDEAERAALAGMLRLPLPSREHMEEIEASSRAYEEEGVLFLTLHVVAGREGEGARLTPVGFAVTADRLITQRYEDLAAFRVFLGRFRAGAGTLPEEILLGLFETVIDHTADMLERVGDRVDRVASRVLDAGSRAESGRSYRPLLQEIGRAGDGASRLRECLVSFELVLAFLEGRGSLHRAGGMPRERLDTLARDLRSLADYASFVSGKIGFLLDAVLGLVGIEQNNIVKIFSVMALIFMPPTLIASIYGMNFRFMPELDWPLGYPLALLLMLLSAILPYRYFRRRGWL